MKKIFIGIIGFLLFNVTVQAESYDLSMKVYHTDTCNVENAKGSKECMISALENNMNDAEIKEEGIKENEIIMVLVNLNIPNNANIHVLATGLEFDNNRLTYLRGVNNKELNQSYSILPYDNDEEQTNWNANMNLFPTQNFIQIQSYDNNVLKSNAMPLLKSGTVSAHFFKVNTNSDNADKITIKFTKNPEKIFLADSNLQKIKLNTTDLDLFYSNTSENQLISSDVYVINRTETNPYIYGSNSLIKINEYIQNLKNNKKEIHFYDINGNEIVNQEQYITTGTKIKLIINDEIKDELTIVIKGDANSDGMVDLIDYILLDNYIIRTIELNDIQIVSLDLDNDGLVTVTDATRLNNYIKGAISTLN